MIPIRDENRPSITPHVTWALIIVNTVIFFVSWLSGPVFLDRFIDTYGMIPRFIMQGQSLHTLLTSTFLHADIIHLFFNMLYLYIFGDNVEDALGHVGYAAFYLFSGLVASAAHLLSVINDVWESSIPTIGASGAISGVLGAYIVLYPRSRVLTLVMYYFITIVPIPAVFFLGFWFLLQFLYVMLGSAAGVAYWAHIGGFVAGLALALLVRKRRKRRLQPLSPLYTYRWECPTTASICRGLPPITFSHRLEK